MLKCIASPDNNLDPGQINYRNDILTRSGNGSLPVAVLIFEEKSNSPEDARRLTEAQIKNELNCEKLHETSFSPMNALIESCVKYSETHSSLSPEEDVGMNLLASVATGEMSRSELISPSDSTERNTLAKEEVCFSNDAKSKCSPEDQIQGTENQQLCNDGESGYKKQALLNSLRTEDGLHVAKQPSFPSEINFCPTHISADMQTGWENESLDSASADTRSNAEPQCEVINKLSPKTDPYMEIGNGEVNKEILEDKAPLSNAYHIINCKHGGTNFAGTENKSGDHPLDTAKGTLMVGLESPNQSCNIDCKSDAIDGLIEGINSIKKITAKVVKSELDNVSRNKKPQEISPHKIFSEAGDAVKVRERDDKDMKNDANESKRDSISRTLDRNTTFEGRSVSGSCSTIVVLKSDDMDGDVEKKEIGEFISLPETEIPDSIANAVRKNDCVRGSKDAVIEVDEVESDSNFAEGSSAATGPDPHANVKFDLNEGFYVDDGKCGEPVSLVGSASTNVPISNSSQVSLNPTPASITVAAAAIGPFVPPEDLLRSKRELGWKGSAATSAFLPAEPRKIIEAPLASKNLSCDTSTGIDSCAVLDIDLNVPNEEVLREMSHREYDFVNDASILLNRSSGSMTAVGSGGPDLDLNRVDESNEHGQCSTSQSHDKDGYVVHAKSLGGLPPADVQRGFDLNDQPGFDDCSAEQLTIIQPVKDIPSQLPFNGPRTNNPGLSSLSSWFLPASTYSTVAIPSIVPDRVDQTFSVIPPGHAQRTFVPAGISSFTPDVYRGSALPSSPAVSFPSPFQFPVVPYVPSFPLPSASFPVGGTPFSDSTSGTRLFAPSVNSQLIGVGPVGAVSSPFQLPFVVGLPDNSSYSGLESSRKWIQGLDLNAGPGAVEGETRELNLPCSSSQYSAANIQLQAEVQARLHPVSRYNQ